MSVEPYLPPGPDPLLTHRSGEGWRVDVLDRADRPVGSLTSVTGGGVDHNANRVIHGGGSLDVDDVGQISDWLDLRVRVWWLTAGVDDWPLGTFLCSAPTEQWDETGRTWQVGLLDKLAILDGGGVDGTYALDAGTVVTDAVTALITAAGETSMAVTASPETLPAPRVWEPGTSWLAIINDLLGAINYYALHTDLYGRYVVAPYIAPGDRRTVRDLTGDAIVVGAWTRDQDLAAVPNRVVLTTTGTSGTEALTAVAENHDPTSRLSIENRGRVVLDKGGTAPTEATSQAVLDALAARRLADVSSPAATRVLEHAPVPDVGLHDVISHEGQRGAVQAWSLNLEVGADVRTTVREV